MAFLFNALENGWKIEKKADCYIFKKNMKGKKEVYLDSYLKHFMKENFNLENFFRKKNNKKLYYFIFFSLAIL